MRWWCGSVVVVAQVGCGADKGGGAAPAVRFVAPAAGAAVEVGAPVDVRVEVDDADTPLSALRLQVWAGDRPLCADQAPSAAGGWACAWTPAAGEDALVAAVRDPDGGADTARLRVQLAEGGADGGGDAGGDGATGDGGAGDGGAGDGGGEGGAGEGGAGDADDGLAPGAGCADYDLGGAIGVVATGRIGGTGDDHPYCGDRGWGDGADLLFSWRAPADGVYSFSTAGSSFDTLLTLYAGLCVEVLACNDDFDDLSSAVDAELRAGDEVVLAIDLYGEASGGTYALTIAEGALPRADTGAPPDSGAAPDSGAPTDTGTPAAPAPPARGWLAAARDWARRAVDALWAVW
jgi:hypothetical protein